MAIKNKCGYLRMIEVMLAITMLSGAILYVYSSKSVPQRSMEEYVYSYHKEVLSEISNNLTLRSYAVDLNKDKLMENIFLPENLDFYINVCELTIPPSPCNVDSVVFTEKNLYEREIYVDETIVASNLTKYNPVKVRLFIWPSSGL